ncbi:uncharacterized protein LOC132169835 [Corylus avellana]|uniref:uncharacterized protein LOC132169835 n=1 Tax=Corylus avellana TaxID=13451 RepID=UPI00286C97E2|nr:uncharacterized protein LOC132169835 [Corylus avellana]
MRFPLPDKFKMPRVDKYDGSKDPSDHMESFRDHIILHDTPDEIACQAFLLTLEGVAKEWFGGLSPKSVDSFDYLGQQFLALMHGIKADGPLMVELSRKSTSGTLRQFSNKVEEFINQEETISALMKSKPEESRPIPDSATVTPKTFVEKKKKKKRDHQKVFTEVKKDPSFRWPGKMKALPQNRTTQKFCEYHNDHRHYTEDCISLQFEMEKFLGNGKLLKFVAEEKGQEKNPPVGQSHQSGPSSGLNNDGLHNQRQRRDEPRVPQISQ